MKKKLKEYVVYVSPKYPEEDEFTVIATDKKSAKRLANKKLKDTEYVDMQIDEIEELK